MLRPRLGFLLLLALSPGALGQSPTQLKKPLIIWGIGLGPDSKGQEAVIREFERRNPDLAVRVLSLGAGRMNPQKLMTSIVGRVPPDVINQDRFTISDWASRGAFRPLDDLIERDRRRDPLCPRPEQYYPSTWAEASFEGAVYAIPSFADNRALYYNRATFREAAPQLREAGLDPERPPRTWSELLAYARVLTKKHPDGSLARAGFMPNFGNSWLYMFAFQNNARLMSEDGRSCMLNSAETERALDFIKEGYSVCGGYERAKAFETGFLSGENDAFLVGKVAMKIDGDWILNAISRFFPSLDFAVAPAPVPDDRYHRRGAFAGEKDRFVSWSGGFSLAIPAGARNTEGAWRYIKFATSTEGRLIETREQRKWEIRKGRAFIPRQHASLEANERIFREFRPVDPKFAAALRTHIDLMPASRIRPVTFVGQMLWDEQVRAMENALIGKMSSARALQEGQATVQRELDNYYQRDRYPPVDQRLPWAAASVAALVLLLGAVAAYRRQRLGPLARSEARWAYLFISPWVVGFLLLTLGPMLASLYFSFTHYTVLSEPRWVGLANYAHMLGEDRDHVAKAFFNALYLAAAGVPLGLATGLAIALLLNGAVRGMRLYRTLFYMPAIVPTAASAVLWLWVLTGDPTKGLLNAGWHATVTQWLDVPPPGWINSEAWAKPGLVLMGVWGAGSGMILWLAGLKGVPTSLYEAASIDGANPRQQFFAVTLPMLSPVILFNAIIGLITVIQEFDRIYIMKAPDGPAGPADSLLTPVFHLFSNGFGYFRMGYASALAWAIFVVILLITLVQLKIAPRWVHYEADR